MANEILKTIKISVDSSEYKALQQSLAKITDYEKKINKLNEQTNEEYKLQKKNIQDKITLIASLLASGKKLKGLTVEETKLEQKKLEKQLKALEINRKLLKIKKDLAKEEREAKFQEAKNNYTKNTAAFAREQQRRKWEQGKESPYALAQRYKGVGGIFNLLSDKAEREGQDKVEGYDRQINEFEEKKKLNEAEMEKYQSELDDPNVKLSKKEIADRQKKIANLKKENEGIDTNIETAKDDKSKAIGDTASKVNKYAAMAQAAQKVARQLNKIAGVLLLPFKRLANATMDAVKQMLDFKTGVATFNTSSSLITNATAREQQMKYGLTSSQNYAFTQAKSMLNIQSDEDLMYMNSDQRDKFLHYMEKYSQWYDKMESSGILEQVQEMQLEFQELKNELAMEFLSWVAANKETIMTLIKGIFNFIKVIADIVMGIIRILSFGTYSGETASDNSDKGQVSISNGGNKNTTINVNANTTNNATGVLSSQEALDQFNKENFNKLAKQIATAIGG